MQPDNRLHIILCYAAAAAGAVSAVPANSGAGDLQLYESRRRIPADLFCQTILKELGEL